MTPYGSFLLYSTFIGGTGSDVPHSAVFDGEDNLWIIRWTVSDDFPVINAFDDTFRNQPGDDDVFVTPSAEQLTVYFKKKLDGWSGTRIRNVLSCFQIGLYKTTIREIWEKNRILPERNKNVRYSVKTSRTGTRIRTGKRICWSLHSKMGQHSVWYCQWTFILATSLLENFQKRYCTGGH
ncbi:MAG: hypothetical protein ACFFD4_14250 [Candidatus Odinarchaeota archaeon]